MKRWTLVVLLLVLVLAAGGLLYANRGAIRDVAAEVSRPQLPTAQPYKEIVNPPLKGEMALGQRGDEPVVQPSAPVEVPVGGAGGGVPSTGAAEASTAGEEPATGPAEAPTTPTLPTIEPAVPTAPTTISSELNLAVPFMSQAPHANWDLPYQESCEEASVIMAAAYFNGETSISPDVADQRILDLVDWEQRTFGFYEDTTAAETVRMAQEHYGLKAIVKPVASIEDVKAELVQGSVVVLPAAGRLLGNPNFRGAGPLYHMIVVKGFLRDGRIITNDPGTRHGFNFLYDPQVLFNAIHDWNGGDVNNGAKVMIVLNK